MQFLEGIVKKQLFKNKIQKDMRGGIGRATVIVKGFSIKHYRTQKCPACNSTDNPKGGILKVRYSSNGKFLGCSRYPECKYTARENNQRQKP
jgi:ssDNA-binding Zn-finger/Zn-ribbon topoisomerase 1